MTPPPTCIGPRTFYWGQRTYIMGIVNCTPDSFSDDGLGFDVEAAVDLAKRMEEQGADIIDVGGESTRPGADPTQPGFQPITVDEEIQRVVPVIRRLAKEVSVPLSIDTYKPAVARAAIEAGAHLINDIWGFRGSPEMSLVASEMGVPAVVMHNQRGRLCQDVIADIRAGLEESLRVAEGAGISSEQLVLDPGFGFGWSPEQNLEMLRRLGELRSLGRPILIGASRKGTIGRVLGLPVQDRLEGTAATVALAVAYGVDIVRVHDVSAMSRVACMADAVVRGNWRQESPA